MRAISLIILATIIFLPNLRSQECLDVDFMLRGYFHAGSSIEDSAAFGGFYKDANVPKVCTEGIEQLSKEDSFQLVVQLDSQFVGNGVNHFKVFIINTTAERMTLPAQDSRLYLKRQAFYRGKWQDVEYLPSSWCGNSYHNVFIDPQQYWAFNAPCIKGEIEAKFRFELYVSEDERYYSSEFDGSFNKKQLKVEQGHNPVGIMDPYNN